MTSWLVGLLLSWVSVVCRAQLLSIDFGSQFFKAYLVHKGKIEAVLNVETKRKTPNVISFREAVRQFGDSGLQVQSKDPKNVIMNFRYLLGLNLTGMSDVSASKLGIDERFYPFNIFADETRQCPVFKVGEKDMYVEELAANVLGFAKSIAQEHGSVTDIAEVAITVPSSATQRQRRALMDAAEIAGFVKTSLVQETASAAIDLMLKPAAASSVKGKVSNALIFNMGSLHTEVSVVSFTTLEHLSPPTPSVTVLASKTVEGLGGNHVDRLLADKMLEVFKEKHPGAAIEGNARAMKKLVVQAQATKQMLSTTPECPFSVECLFEDIDFRHQVKREVLEEITAESFARIGPAVDEVVANSGIEGGLAAIDNVEICGGAWRVPKVQELLVQHVNAAREELNREQNATLDLGKRLDAEEAMAEGAAFILANRSASFRARKILLTDITEFEYTLIFTAMDPEASEEAKNYRVVLSNFFPKGTILNTYKLFHLAVDFNLQMDLLENGNFVTTYQLKGFGEGKIKHNENMHPLPPNVSLDVGIDHSGLFQVRSADAVFEERTPQALNTANLQNDSARPVLVKIKKLPLEVVASTEHLPLPMTAAEKEAARKRYLEAEAFDNDVKATNDARNALESYVYDVKNAMDTELSQQIWANKEQREEISSLASTLGDWLYGDGADTDRATYNEKFQQIEQMVAATPAQSTMQAYIHEVCQALDNVPPMPTMRPTLPPVESKLNESNASKTAKSKPVPTPKPNVFTEEVRIEISSMCTMMKEWLNVDGVNANKAAYEEKYKELEQKMVPFKLKMDQETDPEYRKRKVTPEQETTAKWAGPWAAEAFAAAARARDWVAAITAKANPGGAKDAEGMSVEEGSEAATAVPAEVVEAARATGYPQGASILAVALISLLAGSGVTVALLYFPRGALTAGEEPLLRSRSQ